MSIDHVRLRLADWRLASGAAAPELQVACAVSQPGAGSAAPWVLLLHGISGSHHALAGSGDTSDAGWASGWAGPGRAIDTRRHRVLCLNLPGSCHGSTSGAALLAAAGAGWQHAWKEDQPLLSIADIASAIARAAAALGIERFERVIGYSFGGYVALQMAVAYPQLCGQTMVLASSWCGNGTPAALPALADTCRAAARAPAVAVAFRRDMLRSYGYASPLADVASSGSSVQADAPPGNTPAATPTGTAPAAVAPTAVAPAAVAPTAAAPATAASAAAAPVSAALADAASAALDAAARRWADEFDLRSLLVLRAAATAFDLSEAPPPAGTVRVALADSDRVFALPQALAAIDRARRRGWRIDAEVVNTPAGHAAPTLDPGPWDELLRRWQ